MWERFSASMFAKGGEELRTVHGNLNVNEEYFKAVRTKSYADFLTKAQLLVNEPSSTSYCHRNISEILLEPGQETVAAVLESAILSKNPELKDLILNYFNISAEASKICSNLLTSINQIQSNYRFIQRAFDIIGDYSPEQFKFVISGLDSFILLSNPLSSPDQNDFKLIHEQYSSVLHHLKSKRKKVARRIKFIKYFKQSTGIFLTATCGLVAVAAIVLAAHTVTGLVIVPAIFSFQPMINLKKKAINKFRLSRSGLLRKMGEQLDVAAKGTYILNRDFDTMSRLIGRLHDEIEHSKTMIQFCLERKEDKFPLQEVVKELGKSDIGFRTQVEELEEHIYLCLVTINRARVLVIKEITSCLGSV